MPETGKLPLVSIGFPLYRSARHVEKIIHNIEVTDYPNVEFLVSDRHSLDDCIGLLKEHFGESRNIRYFEQHDRAGWMKNYNFLLHAARGKYFKWIPHDDIVPSCALRESVDLLEQHDDIQLVYGPVTEYHEDGHQADRTSMETHHPMGNDGPWRLADILATPYAIIFKGALKGLFRRERLLQRKIRIRPTHRNIAAERCFLFAQAAVGRFHFLDSFRYEKLNTSTGITHQWRYTPRVYLSVTYRMLRIVWSLVDGLPARYHASLLLVNLFAKKVEVSYQFNEGIRGRVGKLAGYFASEDYKARLTEKLDRPPRMRLT